MNTTAVLTTFILFLTCYLIDGTEQKVISSLGCRLNKGCRSNLSEEKPKEKDLRVIAIGDIHGSYNGLLENLFTSNITTSAASCQWKHQNFPTLLVQSGDIVDRGSGSLEALECLRSLQDSAAAYNAEVVRMFGSKSF
jgi:2',3'-cyclic-nucleotide 2'-phosphodiesterase (5'-nucleotidase family)